MLTRIGSCTRRPGAARRRDPLRARLRGDDGFTLLETLVAAVVLIVGLVSTFGLLDTSIKASAATRAREGATNLAREMLEDARTLAYSQIAPNSITGQLQAMHGLENATPGEGWHITRRGTTYTVAVKECAIDDPKDKSGKHENAFKENPFCKDPGEVEGTEDPQPEDLKRITAEVSWTAIGRKPVVRQVETLTAAGEAPGITASELKLIEPKVSAQTTPVIIAQPSSNKLVFSVQSPVGTAAMEWALDGVRQTNKPTFIKGTEWQFSWPIPLPEISDGAYKVSAQAVDETGVYGPPISISVTLIRSVPAAPKVTYGGFNEVYVGSEKKKVVELQWEPNVERNVIGYRVYEPSPGSALACPNSLATLSLTASCIDFLEAPGAPEIKSANLTYSVVALFRNHEGEALSANVSEGTPGTFTLSKTPQVPNEPVGPLKAEKTEGSVKLSWKAPEGGATPVFYRIYRGSQSYTSRYAVVSPATTEFLDTDAVTAHKYWVTAVSATMTESPFLGPVEL